MVRKFPGIVLALLVFSVVSTVPAGPGEQMEMTPEQMAEMEAYMKAGMPGAPHQELQAEVGNYDVVVKSWMDPSMPPMEEQGSVTRKMILDGRVLVEDFNGSMMGQPFKGQGMHGYDNVTGKHWSTWMDSMSTGLMVSEGTCDAQKACAFTGTMVDPVTKKPMQLRMTSRWTSSAKQVFEMYGPAKSGKGETKMMEILYTKK